ncbi:hypothetical protein [Paenibacillus lautus]|uniref:hypothetical protein n=1 Tax=Paenibacillus lautus TaxID=1401 RepID=UPI003D270416
MQQTESDTSDPAEAEPREMSFEGDDQEPAPAENDTTVAEESPNSNDEEISKEALEQFILKERPSFENIPLDFPDGFAGIIEHSVQDSFYSLCWRRWRYSRY